MKPKMTDRSNNESTQKTLQLQMEKLQTQSRNNSLIKMFKICPPTMVKQISTQNLKNSQPKTRRTPINQGWI